MEDSPIPLEKWLPAIWLITNAKNGISSYEVHRALGVTQKTAWFMLHRIRLAMHDKEEGMLSGQVEADETLNLLHRDFGGYLLNSFVVGGQRSSSLPLIMDKKRSASWFGRRTNLTPPQNAAGTLLRFLTIHLAGFFPRLMTPFQFCR